VPLKTGYDIWLGDRFMLPRFLSPGPLFNLEMTTSVRRARYFALRVLYAAALLFALFCVYQNYNTYRSYGYGTDDIAIIARFSWNFFITFAILQTLAVVVVGPAIAAGTIASERERRTIEYLFTTTLSNAEIVFGKLLARLMHLGYLVLVGMPILAIAMLMGGIAPQAIVVLMIVTLSTALTVSIISITVSVWTPKSREAVSRAYLLIIILFLLPFLILTMLMMLRGSGWIFDLVNPINEQLLAGNPFYVLSNILAAASSANTAAAWDTLVIMLRNQAVICVAGITASVLAVRRVHLAAGGKVAKKRPRQRFSLFRPTVGDRPMLWKEMIVEPAAARLGVIGRIAAMLFVIAIITPTILVFYENYNVYSDARMRGFFSFSVTMGVVIGCVSLLAVAARAAGTITSEKERDCWVSLISTPLDPGEIVMSKILGNMWAMRGVLLLLALIWGLGLIFDPSFIGVIVATLLTLLLLAVFASALGVMFSLWCRTSIRAMVATLITGVFVGGAYMFCCIPLMIGSGNGDIAELLAGGMAPFLLAMPGICFIEGLPTHGRQSGLLIGYVLGIIGYVIASCVLIIAAIKNFDKFSGRICTASMDYSALRYREKSHSAPHVPKAREEAIQAEIVEEA
jgi:ABC-type transport system involved in multi-copper enzyme maturation permease subunit